jgi:hypothetical protein
MSGVRAAALVAVALAVLTVRHAAGRPCTVDSDCQTFGGKCQVGTSYCDVNDTCTPLVTQSCDDGDVCTDDSCSSLGPGNGCVHTPHCPDDGQVCNGIETCVPTPFGPVIVLPLCLPGIAPNCDDGNACTIDSCVEPTGCTHVALNCDDGDLCTQDICDVHQGCLHIPMPGCCKTVADCTQDACSSGAQCVNHVCTAGQATSCDDGDVCTFDGCDPATGCTHTAIAGCCHNDTECATNGDPCAGGCGATHTCDAQPKVGLDAVTCACAREAPTACGSQTVPASVTKRVQHACMLASAPGTGAKELRSLGRAAGLLGKAARTLGGSGAKGVSAECIVALKSQIGDLHGRMASFLDQI